ncbi:MAG: 3-isopropylmalate dehydrogenase [Rhodothermaceae bacterium]|nr:MAG: 3-isopropylmalate dehydrogenase [Rhodothermaceae bacterium]
MTNIRTYRLAVLPGDGIGPEVTREAVGVLEAAAGRFGFRLETATHPVGGAALDATGDPLPPATQAACRAADAVLLGAVGGPAWDEAPPGRRPEDGLLRLRRLLGAFANLRPVTVPAALAGASPLRPERVAGTDLVIVRELTGGIYFGTPRGIEQGPEGRRGVNTMRYDEAEIERIATVAFELAARRRGRVTSVDKANVLDVSRLWREVVTAVHRDRFPEVELDHLYVDNAAMQLVRDPRRFDVVLTANLFGDILSDLAATLPGSLGLLPSASVGGGVGLFEPVHGSAPDLAGTGRANPLAAILSGAMLLEHLGETDAAAAVRRAVAAALDDGFRTPDLAGDGEAVCSTEALGTAVCERLERVEVAA